MPISAETIRAQFPLLNGNAIAYLDNAATTQKPSQVLDAMKTYYESANANINRGVHALAEASTQAYDDARKAVQIFINAKKAHEIIFLRNTTEAINLVARTWGDEVIDDGNVIAVSLLEHHSNIVPWQQCAERNDAVIKWIGIDASGQLQMDDLRAFLENHNVQLVAISAVSNVLGTVTPIKEIIQLAHEADAKVLIDGAQLVSHSAVDVQDLDCDFFVFSGHKMYGPTGIGVLYAKEELLEDMPPFLGGGDMIQTVTKEHFTVAELPRKFEAGTPAIAEAVGLHAAIDWMQSIGIDAIASHEKELLDHAIKKLEAIDGLKILGPKNADAIASCISFTIDGMHPHDLTQLLSEKKIYLRAGHHCAQPLHEHLNISASSRLSVAAYNSIEEIDHLAREIEAVRSSL